MCEECSKITNDTENQQECLNCGFIRRQCEKHDTHNCDGIKRARELTAETPQYHRHEDGTLCDSLNGRTRRAPL